MQTHRPQASPPLAVQVAALPEETFGSRRAFTVVELLIVLLMMALLGSVLVAGSGFAAATSQATRCMNNLGQLQRAWSMYADDNQGLVPPNYDGSRAGKGASFSEAAWVAGWLDYNSANTDNTNTACLIDHVQFPYGAFLGPYLKSANPFKCPSDKSFVSPGGSPVPRVRSYSMNNSFAGRSWMGSSTKFRIYTRIEQMGSPSRLFVILDEHEGCINEGCFFSNPDTRWNIITIPAARHNTGAGFGFADGHCEVHAWKDHRTYYTWPVLNMTYPNDVDIDWLQWHASELK